MAQRDYPWRINQLDRWTNAQIVARIVTHQRDDHTSDQAAHHDDEDAFANVADVTSKPGEVGVDGQADASGLVASL